MTNTKTIKQLRRMGVNKAAKYLLPNHIKNQNLFLILLYLGKLPTKIPYPRPRPSSSKREMDASSSDDDDEIMEDVTVKSLFYPFIHANIGNQPDVILSNIPKSVMNAIDDAFKNESSPAVRGYKKSYTAANFKRIVHRKQSTAPASSSSSSASSSASSASSFSSSASSSSSSHSLKNHNHNHKNSNPPPQNHSNLQTPKPKKKSKYTPSCPLSSKMRNGKQELKPMSGMALVDLKYITQFTNLLQHIQTNKPCCHCNPPLLAGFNEKFMAFTAIVDVHCSKCAKFYFSFTFGRRFMGDDGRRYYENGLRFTSLCVDIKMKYDLGQGMAIHLGVKNMSEATYRAYKARVDAVVHDLCQGYCADAMEEVAEHQRNGGLLHLSGDTTWCQRGFQSRHGLLANAWMLVSLFEWLVVCLVVL